MLVIQVTYPNGEAEELTVSQAEFVRICQYSKCHKRFLTINVDQRYCKQTHAIMAYQQRHFGTIAQARAATTVGMA